ncbi:GNAT family N-acetyltransferase [Demetria terragena]|uniref:GNAT family N-acetyltransferase n=1 Tax=Demetria terragena TaxID=63959 RepID=UPI000371A56E|nr:GNAT family N-acetyltransferase [Demetria terragena]
MTITLETPSVDGLAEYVEALGEWQHDAAPFQLHPGDLGWNWQFGADALAAGMRAWRRDGRIVALGIVDDGVMRLTSAPDAQHDEDIAARIAADLDDPDQGIFGTGEASLEAPTGALVHPLLAAKGWVAGESWTPLQLDLSAEVAVGDLAGLTITDTGTDQVEDRLAVHQSAFKSKRFVRSRWDQVVIGLPYANARSLLGYAPGGEAVAMITVWSAGPGRPGIIEPMGVHQDHTGHGYGRAITLAGAAALREMGASSAGVATPSSNTGAVKTYQAAGFEALPERLDTTRP